MFLSGKVEEGFEIFHVYPDTPADEIGLQVGDIIIEINGESTYDLMLMISYK